MESEGAAVADAPDLDVTRVVRRRDAVGVGARGRRPARGGRLVVESFVRSYVVVGLAEGIEDALLEIEVGRRRLRDLGLQRLVHAFVSAVLLRATWRDALVSDAELQPPDVESSEAVNPGRGKGCAVVAANGVGQAMLAEEAHGTGA